MIPLPRIDKELAKRHFEAFDGYLTRPRMNAKYNRIKQLVSHFTNGAYNFESLLTASYDELELVIVPAWNNYSQADRQPRIRDINLFKTLYNYLGRNNYLFFNDPKNGNLEAYNTQYFFSQSKINVCPYCNENYTYQFTNGKRNYDLDHFFNKDKYPILALSIFNLVPCCKVCNFFKKEQATEILSPYSIYKTDDVFKWKLKISSTDYLINDQYFELERDIDSNHVLATRMNNNLQLFQLDNRYSLRKDIILDTLRRKQMYNEDYIVSVLNDFEGKFFRNKEDVVRMIFSTSLLDEDDYNRPFSKLIRDVFNDEY